MKKTLLKLVLIGATLSHSYGTDMDSEDINQRATAAYGKFDEGIFKKIFTFALESSGYDEEEFKNMSLVSKVWKNILHTTDIKEIILGYYRIDLSQFNKKEALAQLNYDLHRRNNIRHLTILGQTNSQKRFNNLYANNIFPSKFMGRASLQTLRVHGPSNFYLEDNLLKGISWGETPESRPAFHLIKDLKELDISCGVNSTVGRWEHSFFAKVIPALTQLEKIGIGFSFNEDSNTYFFIENALKNQNLREIKYYEIKLNRALKNKPFEVRGTHTFHKEGNGWTPNPKNPQNALNDQLKGIFESVNI